MIGEGVPYVVAEPMTICFGDYIKVIKADGKPGIRWLKPGTYRAGEVIPEGENPDRIYLT